MGELIRVRGTVQGVGFRPTVARLARAQQLSGFVRNDGSGVTIGLAADTAACERFLEALLSELPPLAHIEHIERTPADVRAASFDIQRSAGGPPRTAITTDSRLCLACDDEIRDPFARRFRYPFTSCTNCGPRYSVVEAVPYDRQNTSLAAFPLCAACRQEYEDETDRRYHAQALACPRCGPTASLEPQGNDTQLVLEADPIAAAARLIREGQIVAIKGLGGYQLCCDATNPVAVRNLRARKRRAHRAFALMVRDLAAAARLVTLSDADRALLESPQGPILLADRSEDDGAPGVCDEVAPGQRRLGVMLPTSPLHSLLMADLDVPIVCTSGNLTDEPQCIDDDDARRRLGGVADWLVSHDRPIRNRVDDSVVATIAGQHRVLRRARGYAPTPIQLPRGFESTPDILALGADLKATFALISSGQVILSPHLGDLHHARALEAFDDTLRLLRELHHHAPRLVALDAHAAYHSHRLGADLALALGVPTLEVAHHHAHVVGCLAEHGWARDRGAVLGLALDGLGAGPSGELLGGELLLCDYSECRWLATLAPIPLLGGDAASRAPWRCLYAQLDAAFAWSELEECYGGTAAVRLITSRRSDLLDQALRDPTLSPPASSTGRLFDAVAAALGLAVETQEYEGHAAMLLESLITNAALERARRSPYAFSLGHSDARALPCIEPAEMWGELLQDLRGGADRALVAARFHVGLARIWARLVERAREETGKTTVALSGGCFQNRVLTETLKQHLDEAGFEVLLHRRVPPNDACIALGQALIAAARMT
ncbi:MAG: carbamoyltransferase HypF [Polyangiaceae bacterium]